MRSFLISLFLISLTLNLVAVSSAAAETYTTESSKLVALRALEPENGVIDLSHDQASFSKFVFQGPRDYTVVLSISSATDRFKCDICRQWNPAFNKVASTHAKMEKRSNRLFFVQLDIGFVANELRQKLGGKIRGLPFVMTVGPTKSKSSRFDVEEKSTYQNILDGDVAFAVWVNKQADVHIRIVDYKRITMVVLALLIGGSMIYMNFNRLWKLAHNPMAYFAACMVGYCLVCGGLVFSYIHKSPFFAVDHQGSTHWIMPSARDQLGAEGLVMASVIGGGAVGWVVLSGIMPYSKRPKSAIVVVLIITFVLMLIGRKLFQWKHPYYPY
jgi:hypothetical protein